MTDKNYIIESWWIPSQIDLVKDKSRIWTKREFKTTSGFWSEKDGGKLLGKTSSHEAMLRGAVVDDTAWDHEHCELCFETISDKEGYQKEGYTDGKEWLCTECYNKYIGPFRNNE